MRHPPRRRSPVSILLVLAFTAAGCGFFDTRDPIDDGDQKTVPRLPPTVPENVLFNYLNAVRCGIVGVTQFGETLDDGFLMTFDQSDSLELGFGSGVAEEIIEAFRLQSTGQDSFLFTFEEQEPELGANTAFYNRIPYEAAVLDVQPDTVIVVTRFSATADIRLQTNNAGNWVIRTWQDYRDASGNATWGRYLADRILPGKPGSGARLP